MELQEEGKNDDVRGELFAVMVLIGIVYLAMPTTFVINNIRSGPSQSPIGIPRPILRQAIQTRDLQLLRRIIIVDT